MPVYTDYAPIVKRKAEAKIDAVNRPEAAGMIGFAM
jgi:hypothetical protein